jgi:hypothetical protein
VSSLTLSLADYLADTDILMASTGISDREETNTSPTATTHISPFEESQISSTVTADDAVTFFKEHGIFYKADAEIGRRARELGSNNALLKEMLMRDSVSMVERVLGSLLTSLLRFASILEPFINGASAKIWLGADQGNFFALALHDNHDHRLVVYIWPGETTFDFFDGSHKGLNKGVPAANGRFQIPYSWLKDEDKRNLTEFRGVMKEGGVYVCIITPFGSF